MRRRSVVWGVLIVVAAAGLLAAGLVTAVKQEPDFYAATVAAEPEDEATAAVVLTRFNDLRNDMLSRPEWGATFTAEELNAFLRQRLDDDEGFAGALPRGVSGVRVSLAGDRLRVAARYTDDLDAFGWVSTVGVLELKVWLTEEVNTVAVQVCDLRAGGLSVSARQWLDQVTELVREHNVQVTWYRHEGLPVGLFRFYADQTRPTTQIRTVKVGDGRVTVGGKWLTDPGPAPKQ